ncbi:YqaE/Pmp3 family membrane protein [Halomonas piscis]|uniref:YqaE/Pmp3 family membrane protein n=1 Tax=Halomonas piscis TaxID=3031727 RepID=A0ABY9YX48_9GAMM|nr:YqaE/Pmp3 family membrane protein [Halomonas piscis]WNK19182.1 YqaE/Pmp3 family membrane protein [Halomonas piscis]
MDAREYLSRKGVALDSDPDRTNTLEEKAWERARQAGQHRPKTGTPHDWEDWERYHGELAEGAASLEQKIDREAHREQEQEPVEPPPSVDERPDAGASEAASTAPKPASAAVGHFTPPAPEQAFELEMPDVPEKREPAVLNAAYAALAVLLPPLAVGLSGGNGRRVAISAALTLLLWIPGVIYAIAWLRRP